MRKHRIEIRVLCVLQKAKQWDEGTESEDVDGGGFEAEDIESADIEGEGIEGDSIR